MKYPRKSSRFIKLLPKIYEKLVIEQLDHTSTALWLLTEHDLNLFPIDEETKTPLTDHYPKLFYTYLSRYGDLKKAKKDFKEMFGDSEDNWLKKLNVDMPQPVSLDTQTSSIPVVTTELAKKVDQDLPLPEVLNLIDTKPFSQNEMLENLTLGSNVNAVPSLAEKLNLDKKPPEIFTNPLEGYKSKRFTH